MVQSLIDAELTFLFISILFPRFTGLGQFSTLSEWNRLKETHKFI